VQTGKEGANTAGHSQAFSSVGAPAATDAADLDRRAGAAAAGLASDAEDAWTIEEFAALADLTEDEVWERLKDGSLTGRMRLGQILVYGPVPTRLVDEHVPTHAPGAMAAEGELPPLPLAADELDAFGVGPAASERTTSDAAATDAVAAAPAGLAVRPESQVPPEIALLLDHLSLAKEENREILRMTQESIRKVTELSEQLVEGKEQLIRAKDVEIHALRDAIEVQRREISRLRQQHEDLEMLARTLSTSVERAES
jgi:hypothetical protein